MSTPHKHADILRAIADGKEGQYKVKGMWWTSNYYNPITHPDLEWRVKPEKLKRWVNIYDFGSGGCLYTSKNGADEGSALVPNKRIACIEIEFEVGQGLE